MRKPDPLAYEPEKLDSERETRSLLLQRMVYDRESLNELLKIVNTEPATEPQNKTTSE